MHFQFYARARIAIAYDVRRCSWHVYVCVRYDPDNEELGFLGTFFGNYRFGVSMCQFAFDNMNSDIVRVA